MQALLYQTLTPKGRYLQSIKNLRKTTKVVCSNPACQCEDNLTVHHVLPQFIGRKMKLEDFLKCMTVVLCRDCHDEYERSADKVRLDWAEELGVNLKLQKRFRCKSKEFAKKYAFSILHSVDTMNDLRLFERIDFILSYLSKDHYTNNDLIKLSNLDPMIDNPNYQDLGEIMIEKVTQEKLIEFWQEHFFNFIKQKSIFLGVAA